MLVKPLPRLLALSAAAPEACDADAAVGIVVARRPVRFLSSRTGIGDKSWCSRRRRGQGRGISFASCRLCSSMAVDSGGGGDDIEVVSFSCRSSACAFGGGASAQGVDETADVWRGWDALVARRERDTSCSCCCCCCCRFSQHVCISAIPALPCEGGLSWMIQLASCRFRSVSLASRRAPSKSLKRRCVSSGAIKTG